MTLNAAFETLGFGQTWWLHREQLEGPPPSPDEIAFVETLGRGDLESLVRLRSAATLPEDLDTAVPCRISPLQVTVLTRRPESAEWLIRRGATPDLVSLWDLRWVERIGDEVSRRPELLDRRLGSDRSAA